MSSSELPPADPGDALARLGAVERRAREASTAAAGLESKVLRSLLALETRIIQAQVEDRDSADAKSVLDDLTQQVSRLGEALLTSLRALESRFIEGQREQTQQIRLELLRQVQNLQATLDARIESLESKVDAGLRTTQSNQTRSLEALEMLQHKISSISQSIEHSREQAQSENKRSDERMARALQAIEMELNLRRNDGAPITPAARPPQTTGPVRPELAESADPILQARMREEQLVALMLDQHPEGGSAKPA